MKQEDFLTGVEEESASYNSGPVECLGMTFESDDARREHFTAILREKLKDPEFRKIEGFPIGEDEDILNLSDPPYYTACPNPFIEQFVEQYGTPYDPEEEYSREPYAADVSEGKNDPIYNAHSYHTKVPHKAIMRYILHYTKPGDLVFDGFCGTGMTGVAAQMCGDKATVESLGYRVLADDTILAPEQDESDKTTWVAFSKLGERRVLLNDLSPAATHISYHYNKKINLVKFERNANKIIKEIELECGWMYETSHTDGRKGKINYTIWSDVFLCRDCSGEVVFWDQALDINEKKMKTSFSCPHCQAQLNKKNVDRCWITELDPAINQVVKTTKQVPVLINYSVDGEKGKFEKKPDFEDQELINKIEKEVIPYWFPSDPMMFKGEAWGDTWRAGVHAGVTHTHHFYTKRNLWVLAAFWNKFNKDAGRYSFLFTASQRALSRLASIAFSYYFHGGGGFINAGTKGTLYISSTNPEVSAFNSLRSRMRSMTFELGNTKDEFIIENRSATSCSDKAKNTIDYIFIDPPFGANIMYSELNFLWEPWLRVLTKNNSEAIESSSQNKSADEYRFLMSKGFQSAYKLLKPGRWITVEFSNTKASVWNNIQTAITEAGFIVANVSALDKKQGSFKAYTTPTAVKQDLVITAYKPSSDFENRFEKETPEEGVWDFVHNHLKYLPTSKQQAGELVATPERDPRILFDQMVAYFVRHGRPVPISSPEFQSGLIERFVERDGMIFLPDQVAEYDKKRVSAKQLRQMSIFVDDEASAIEWLRQQLIHRPMTYQDVHPMFLNELSGWKKNEKPLELRDMLEQNFLQYDGDDEVPSQIHSYLSTNHKDLRKLEKDDPKLIAKAKDRWYVPDPNKAADLEKLRERALVKEFETYKDAKKKIKKPRGEALRAGFKKAWETNDYQQILDIADKIPPAVLQEDEKLLMYYDNAKSMGGDDDFDW